MANEGLSDFSLEGKSAVVVGAETAVGLAAAVVLAEAGAKLLLASQQPGTEQKLKEAAKIIGGKPIIQAQRAASRADSSATADLAVNKLGRLDIVVNALDAPSYGAAETMDDSGFDQVVEDNFKAVWTSCQEFGRVMLQRGGGAIVNMSTILATRGVANAAVYCAAKAAVLNYTRALALEWARREVRVNAILAGWLEEPGSPAMRNDDFSKSLLKYLPYNRLVKPAELGGALLYLVSPAAAFVTGEAIAVDGGLRCRV